MSAATSFRFKSSKSFNEARAPMTAKCIMRDVLVANGLSEAEAMFLVAKAVREMHAEGYSIETKKD